MRLTTIIISGAPGTGKSAIRRHAPYFFRQYYGAAAALDTDEYYPLFDPQWTTNNRDWWKIATDTSLYVADYLLRCGVVIVAISSNGLYTPEAVNHVLAVLGKQSTIYHVTLDAPLATLIARVEQRGDLAEHPADWLAAWQTHIRSYYAAWTYVLDNGNLSLEETLEAIHVYIGDERNALSTRIE